MGLLQQSCVYYNRMILYVQQYLLITLKFHENQRSLRWCRLE